jgi:hypothetical protein
MAGQYRNVNPIQLKPVYISLGIPKTTFTASSQVAQAPFNAAMACGPANPDSIWLFRGENCLRFNIATGQFEQGPDQIGKSLGKGSWPALFASGIDAAVWGGPEFPYIAYFFKESQYARLNLGPASGLIDVAPRAITMDFKSAQGVWFANGCDAALHDPRIKYKGMLHIFKGSEYMRHDLNSGGRAAGPVPITQEFTQLPAPFSQKVDIAFYGAGQDTEKIYFMSGDQLALYDPNQNVVEQVWAVEERFPAMAQYVPRPQLFLVEDYSLNMYAGDLQDFAPVGALNLQPRTTSTVRVVTQTVGTVASAQQQSLITSQSDATVTDFYNQLQNNSQQSGASDQYNYGLDASFHGDASATGLTGGEVNANLSAKGGSDDVRNAFAKAAVNTLSDQVNKSTTAIQTTTQNASDSFTKTDYSLSESIQTIDNSKSEVAQNFTFWREAEPYLTLLVLTGERVAYVDQSGADIEDMPSLDALLQRRIGADSDRAAIRGLIVGELSSIADYNGVPRTIIRALPQATGATGPAAVAVDTGLTSTYDIRQPDGSTQSVAVTGIIKSAKTGTVPTNFVFLKPDAN